MKSISVNNITKKFGEVTALNNISLDVEDGEIFGLIGPDGAGKTTLIRILTTLILPDSGNASVTGLDVVKNYKKLRGLVGYMPGKFSLYLDLTVEENMKLFATIFGTTIKENYELVKDIYSQIEPFKNRQAGQLSGGMKQKLALSCALIHKPKVLFLDEPTTGVDPVSRKELWDMLKKLKKEGITIFVSTAYMDEASLCDRVALIQLGKILEIDPVDKIISNFSKQLISLTSDNTHKLINDLKQYPLTHNVYPFGDSVHYIEDCKEINREELIKFLMSRNTINLKISDRKPDIEDCFIDLMGKADGK